MKTIIVKSGFGFYREIATGKNICQAKLQPGNQQLSDDFNYIEVADQAELDAINIDEPTPTQAELDEQKIENKKRELAVEALIAAGELPPDFGVG